MNAQVELVRLAEAFSAATGRSQARIANLAGCDGAFFRRLAEGRSCLISTSDWVRRWFARNWPNDAHWPDGIERPAPLTDDELAERASRRRPIPQAPTDTHPHPPVEAA